MYWNNIKNHVLNIYEENGYDIIDHISYFNVKVWIMDIKSNSKINISGYCNRLFIIQFKYFYSYYLKYNWFI